MLSGKSRDRRHRCSSSQVARSDRAASTRASAGPGAAVDLFSIRRFSDALFLDQEFDVGPRRAERPDLASRSTVERAATCRSRWAIERRSTAKTHAPIPNDTVPTKWLQVAVRARRAVDSPSRHARDNLPARAASRESRYASIGLVSHILDPWLVLGLHALVPIGNFTQMNSFGNDELVSSSSNSLHPELYSDRLTRDLAGLRSGESPWKRLSIGLTLHAAISRTPRRHLLTSATRSTIRSSSSTTK